MGIDIVIAIIILSPALTAAVIGVFFKKVTPSGVNFMSISSILLSFIFSIILAIGIYLNNDVYIVNYFSWAWLPCFDMEVSFIGDRLSVFMLLIVIFVSTVVQIYSTQYMSGDPGYVKFFAYILMFTFSMNCLVMSNNFLVLFFGWEGVGLFSYLLIGFYSDRTAANEASFRAFIINRIGDLGLLLGIAAVIYYCNSIDFNTIFATINSADIDNERIFSLLGIQVAPTTLICLLLFIGAMGKSAQFPLHVWLEGSMEGPTPISALIHAATMVTAGIFMISRLSPIFVHSEAVLSFIMINGAITCFMMGLVAIVQTDIKRVIAYCTLSQLGYMMIAQGSSSFSLGMFHLMIHAAAKALIFLSAGSVIIALKYQQNILNMGGLKKSIPITYIFFLVSGWTLAALPPFSGFFSKDLIINSVKISTLPGHEFSYWLALLCSFITSFYIFRMIFIVFHGYAKSENQCDSAKERSLAIWLPSTLLALPSIFLGIVFSSLLLTPGNFSIFGNTIAQYYDSISVGSANILKSSGEIALQTSWGFIAHSIYLPSFWLAIIALLLSYSFYVAYPNIPCKILTMNLGVNTVYCIISRKYFIDNLYSLLFVKGSIFLSKAFSVIDTYFIDKILVQGISNVTLYISRGLTFLQRGYLFDYVFAMLIGTFSLIVWLIFWVN